ncbi:MAG: GDP-mannose 4,6-dehydratase [Candidatus Vogelbacteria bacterium]|nr:GDP-mannose 4,6-dehydratase [Candidatus Vogelbacteria bacterium]
MGFHLANRLLSDGCRVVGVDNITDYYDPKIKQKRNKILLAFPKYKFYKKNIADFKSLSSIVKKEKPDAIVHLAAQAGVRYSLTNPWAYTESNYLGTLNIFEAAKVNKIKRVIFASSSSVYGKNKEMPFSESHTVDHPISIYAASKKANEVLAHSYHHLYGIETAGLRFFTVYGEYGRPDLALFKFAKNILLDKPIDVYNNGEMARDFTYVGDIVDGIIAALNKKDLKYEIYNLGGENPVTLMTFIKLIEDYLGKKANIKFLPMQPGDVKETFADINKARRDLGFDPKVKIDEGVKKFLNWFVKNKSWLLKLQDGKQ